MSPQFDDRLADYVDVPERIRELRDAWPDARLRPVDPAEPFRVVAIDGHSFVVYAAACYRGPDDPLPGIGLAWEPVPGLTPYTRNSELQNAETSAWGRAIVAALVADAKRIATTHDIRNRTEPRRATPDELTRIMRTIERLPEGEIRERVTAELRARFGPSAQLAHDDVPAVLDALATELLDYDDGKAADDAHAHDEPGY